MNRAAARQEEVTTESEVVEAASKVGDVASREGRKQICLVAENSKSPGGFSNSVALANSIMHSALMMGFGFVHRPIVPIGHNIGSEFINVFIDPEKTSTLVSIRTYASLICRARDCLTFDDLHPELSEFRPRNKPAKPASRAPGALDRRRCSCWAHDLSATDDASRYISDPDFPTYVLQSGVRDEAPRSWTKNALYPDTACVALIRIKASNNVQQLHNYTLTAPYLQRDYHRHVTPAMPIPRHVAEVFTLPEVRPIRVALHHRLGDVATIAPSTTNMHDVVTSKRMSIAWPVFALSLLFAVVRPECVSLFLLSEGSKSDAELQALHRAFGKRAHILLEEDLPPPSIPSVPSELDDSVVGLTRRAFDIMAYADILVAATSGFSRFAAVLSRNVRIAPEPVPSHPLTGISDDIVLVPKRDIFWAGGDGDGSVGGVFSEAETSRINVEAMRSARAETALIAQLRERIKQHAFAKEHASCFID